MTDEPINEPTTDPVPEMSNVPAELAPHDKTMGLVCHLISLCGLLGIPFGNIVGPLAIWLIKKDEIAFVDDQGKESLNFQIFATIVGLVVGFFAFIISLTGIGLCLAIPMMLALFVAWLIFVILASVAANKGEAYRYPYTIRFIK